MNKLVSMVALVVCLAGLASGGSLGAKNELVDFEGLARLLNNSLKDNQDVEENLAFIKENLSRMTDGERRAAEVVEQVKGVNTCNDGTIRLLATIVHRLMPKIFLRRSLANEFRIYDIIKSDLRNITGLCEPYIDQQLESKAAAADDELKEFLGLTRPWYPVKDIAGVGESSIYRKYDMENTHANYIYCVSDDYRLPTEAANQESQEINEDLLNDFLNELAAHDGQSANYFTRLDRSGYRVADERNFEAGFSRYLVEPCKKFARHFEPLFDGAHAIASLGNKYTYVKGRSVQFRQLAYTNKICQAVLILDDNNDSQGKLRFRKEDMLRFMVQLPQLYRHHYPIDDLDSDSDYDSDDEY